MASGSMEINQQPTAPASADARPVHNNNHNNHSSARSCITCAKAKAKCVRQSGRQICDRCARLHKDCQLKEPVQRRRKPAKLSRTAQLENLENKLQNLVHALSAQQSQQSQQQQTNDHGHPSPSTSSGASDQEMALAESIISSSCNQASISDKHIAQCGPPHSTDMTPGSSYQATRPMTYDSTLSMDEANILLDRYKRLLAPSMPFVVLEDGIDAWSLTHKKPFLMQVIAAVSYFHDLPKQQVMVKDLMRQISEKLMMRNEKSLEVLQGMLILIAWYHPHIIWAQQSVLLLHLAMSLTADLNIDRAPDSCEKFRLAHSSSGCIPPLPPFTNDERRAFLGTFYLTSMMSTSFKKLSALKWSPWMTDCAKTLEREKEYESDAFLISIVRIQHLTEDIMAIETFDAPVQFLANSYQADLDKIPKPTLTGRPKILLEQQESSAQAAIWTHSLTGLAEKKTPSTQNGQLRQRLDGLWRCVESLRGFFEHYLAITPQDMLILPFQIFGQSVQASVTLLRLATLEVDGWDLNALRGELNYSAIMGEITRRFESVEKTQIDGLPIVNDSFTKWAAKTRWMKTLYDTRYPSPDETSPAAAAVNINISDGGRRWPDGTTPTTYAGVSLQEQQPQQIGTGPVTTTTTGTFVPPLQQQPTPSDEWLTSISNPQNVFTYFDDAFWNSVRFDSNFDFGPAVAAAAGPEDVQMGAYAAESSGI